MPATYDQGQYDFLVGLGHAARIVAAAPRLSGRKIQLVTLTGFLGAGKTTLLQRLLTNSSGRRVAAVVNDFGEINIDASLVRRRDASVISLTNGCACCSIAGGLTRVLLDLTTSLEPPDAIVIEASGVANPLAILHTALANSSLRMGALIAVVDSDAISRQISDQETEALLLSQVKCADIVLLNKIDISGVSKLHEAERWIRRTNPQARIVCTSGANIPVEVAFGINHELSDKIDRPSRADHASVFTKWKFTSPNCLDRNEFTTVMANSPDSIIRAKGLMYLQDDPLHEYVYQQVGSRWSWERLDRWSSLEPRSDLVLIGLTSSQDMSTQRFLQDLTFTWDRKIRGQRNVD